MELAIDKKSKITIQQQLIGQVSRAISNKELEQGDALPSINQLSNELKISRDTIFKAYKELKNIGVVASTPAKGYYVKQNLKKVLLLLDYFSPFKDRLHNAFKKELPEDYSIDLVFHHYNKRLFRNIVQQSIGMYDAFVVMNYDTDRFKADNVLKKIDPTKLSFIDIPIKEWSGLEEEKISGIFQDFDQSVYDCLFSIKDKIKHYQQVNLVHTESLKHPSVTNEYFIRFCYDHDIRCDIIKENANLTIDNKNAYLVIRQSDLSSILKQCKEKGYKLGSDVGLIAYNDAPLYEFIGEGISAITTDFEAIGRKAAQNILNQNYQKEIIPSKVVIRGSI